MVRHCLYAWTVILVACRSAAVPDVCLEHVTVGSAESATSPAAPVPEEPFFAFLFTANRVLLKWTHETAACSSEAVEFLKWAAAKSEIDSRYRVWVTHPTSERDTISWTLLRWTGVATESNCPTLFRLFAAAEDRPIVDAWDSTKLRTDGIQDLGKLGFALTAAYHRPLPLLVFVPAPSLAYRFNVCYMQHHLTWQTIPIILREFDGTDTQLEFNFSHGTSSPTLSPSLYPLDMPTAVIGSDELVESPTRLHLVRQALEAVLRSVAAPAAMSKSNPTPWWWLLRALRPPADQRCHYAVETGQPFRAVVIISLAPLSKIMQEQTIITTMFHQFVNRLLALHPALFTKTVGGIYFDCDIPLEPQQKKTAMCATLRETLSTVRETALTQREMLWARSTQIGLLEPDSTAHFAAAASKPTVRARRLGILSGFSRHNTLFVHVTSQLPDVQPSDMAVDLAPMSCYSNILGDAFQTAVAARNTYCRRIPWACKENMPNDTRILDGHLHLYPDGDSNVNSLTQDTVLPGLASLLQVLNGAHLLHQAGQVTTTPRLAIDVMRTVERDLQSQILCVASCSSS